MRGGRERERERETERERKWERESGREGERSPPTQSLRKVMLPQLS